MENYVATHELDENLVLSTTVEDVSQIAPSASGSGLDRWKLTVRKHDALRRVDVWWTEDFDALVIANGHYSVPFVSYKSNTSSCVYLGPS